MVDYKDIAIRAGKTFAQAFLGSIIAGLVFVDSVEGLKALFIASVAAGLSGLQNWVRESS